MGLLDNYTRKNLLWEILLVDFVHKTWSLKSPEEKEIGLEKKVES